MTTGDRHSEHSTPREANSLSLSLSLSLSCLSDDDTISDRPGRRYVEFYDDQCCYFGFAPFLASISHAHTNLCFYFYVTTLKFTPSVLEAGRPPVAMQRIRATPHSISLRPKQTAVVNIAVLSTEPTNVEIIIVYHSEFGSSMPQHVGYKQLKR